MDKRLAAALIDAINNDDQFDEEPARLSEDYSGRGMYGQTTTGVSTDVNMSSVLTSVLNHADVFAALMADGVDTAIRTDDLGRGIIIY